ncbi:hypothetical protein [uncultured Sphingomonas sp.]|uniref:hypothetical protein n=1 Tax=uncultured Sphingomonas sp. TaxID=158754 RepID=UPI0035C96719
MTPEDVTPEDVCAALAHPAATPPADLPPAEADAILASISASYFRLRRGMALVAFALPPTLWLGGGLGRLQGSLSAYYHHADGQMRDVLVGALWALGTFLYFYKGYSRAEDLALDGAGLAAVLVAVAPMDWPAGAPATLTGRLHAAAAIGFFLLIAYVCVFRSGDTLRLLRDEAQAATFRATYRLLGLLMVALPLAVWAVHALAPARENSPVLFLVEAAGVYVFAAFWWIKSREIAALERQ